jgi:hypothetical protein
MNEELISYVNEQSKENGIINRIYGIRRNGNAIEALILDDDKPMFWFNKVQLCRFHERLIDKWIELGGKIE